jgi:hypothetical protein
MLYIIYNTASKLIVNTRLDLSSPAPSPAEFWMADYAKSHNVLASEYTIVVHPDNDAQVWIGRDKYDPDTQTIYADPNWVAPTPTPAEPTA